MIGIQPALMAQDEHPPSTPAEKRAVTTIRDALKALDQTSTNADPSRSMTPIPIGNPGQWFGSDAYPPSAIRAGAQGRVIATVAVNAAGRATGCVVTQSSGSSDLDAATCRIATSRMIYTPAHDAGGHAIVGQYRLPVRWVLPNPVMATPVNISVQTQIAVATDGTVEACETEPALPPGTPGPCLGWPVGRRIMTPQLRDGKPVKAHIVISMDIVTTLDP